MAKIKRVGCSRHVKEIGKSGARQLRDRRLRDILRFERFEIKQKRSFFIASLAHPPKKGLDVLCLACIGNILEPSILVEKASALLVPSIIIEIEFDQASHGGRFIIELRPRFSIQNLC